MPQMSFEQTKELADEYGIPMPVTESVTSQAELKDALRDVGYPVVLKLLSPDVIHKSDEDAVILDIETQKEALGEFKRLKDMCSDNGYAFDGVMVQQQVGGHAVLVGLKRDPQFGPVVAFGLGGIFVEIMEDVSFRVCPVDDADIEEMVREIKGYPILSGARGEEPVDMDTVKNVVKAVSLIGMERDDIKELDINPLVASPDGAWAVDFRVIL